MLKITYVNNHSFLNYFDFVKTGMVLIMVEHAILEATEDLSIQLERLGRGNDTLGTASSLLSQPIADSLRFQKGQFSNVSFMYSSRALEEGWEHRTIVV